MNDQSDMSNDPRTVIVILGTHRSGSSLTARILHKLGMSLGPFELIGPLESNRHGHFEPVPINHFDMRLQQQIFGFDGDMPHTEEVLHALLQSDGRWPPDVRISEDDLEFGRLAIRQLVDSGKVSGFKDPRVALLWPFWHEALSQFPGLRVILLTLLRSPHEIAMSIFMRGKGQYTYHDALNVTAMYLRRIQDIYNTWDGEHAVVRFDTRVYAEDMRIASEKCGLPWRNEFTKEIYDSGDRHYEPTRVAHDAQRVFDELSGLPESLHANNALLHARDSALREKLIQKQLVEAQLQQQRLQEDLDRCEQIVDSFSIQHDLQQAIECLGSRLQAIEENPFQRVARYIGSAYLRFEKQDAHKKVA